MTRRGVVLVVGLAALLSACGQSTQDTSAPVTETETETVTVSPTPTTTSTPSPESTPSETKCVAANLSGTIANADAGAGNRYADLVVTNKGPAACTLYGYGGLEFVGADGKANPTQLIRTPDPGPSLVTVPPGGTAVKRLHWGVIPSGAEPATGPCQPPSTGIRVIPPDDTNSFAVSYEFGSVCSGGRVEGSAYARN